MINNKENSSKQYMHYKRVKQVKHEYSYTYIVKLSRIKKH
jgi:hypothetical protein